MNYRLGVFGLFVHPELVKESGRNAAGIFFFQAEDGIRDYKVTGVDVCSSDLYETILNNTNLNVTKDQFEQVGGDSHVHVKGDENIKIDGTYSLNSGQDH